MINRQSQSILTAARTLIAALAACAVIFVFQGGTGISAVSASNFKRLDFAPPQKRNDGNAVPGRFFLAFDGTVSSRLRREVGLPLAYIDILGGRIAMSPLVMPFADGPA
ncbi:MAG TPA: hypothetical protein PLY73_10300, partial [Candidatus Ozemobacteraceae bacterium]|nr:hypothetical protein [Candidatus Ozemobacteraceae bacterium]